MSDGALPVEDSGASAPREVVRSDGPPPTREIAGPFLEPATAADEGAELPPTAESAGIRPALAAQVTELPPTAEAVRDAELLPTLDAAGQPPPPTDATELVQTVAVAALLPAPIAEATELQPAPEAGLPDDVPSPIVAAIPPVDIDRPSSDEAAFVVPAIDSVRLRSTLRMAVRIGIFAGAASIAIAGVAWAASTFSSQYGAVQDAPNAATWASLSPGFAGQAICISCHITEADAQDASAHANVSCEDCHGPAAAHASSEANATAIVLSSPTSAICVTCHGATSGRPTTFIQVDPTRHFSGGPCLRCHSPHSIAAVRPPTVTHPLADLPQCTTCHNPDGLKKVPTGHEMVSDVVCLSCHGRAASGTG